MTTDVETEKATPTVQGTRGRTQGSPSAHAASVTEASKDERGGVGSFAVEVGTRDLRRTPSPRTVDTTSRLESRPGLRPSSLSSDGADDREGPHQEDQGTSLVLGRRSTGSEVE